MLTNVKGEQMVAMMVTANVVTHRVHIIVHVMQATTSVTTERHVFVSHCNSTIHVWARHASCIPMSIHSKKVSVYLAIVFMCPML